ncbi:otoancorin isoform X2 [Amblyraja radiata]|uniref:otoancorin isoform X2 n=1 Tax=Amblyraja radiata TaxID=386614 RepID=UPI001402E741|nr:otoancorin isoform X2 [Amblyraja radiata]
MQPHLCSCWWIWCVCWSSVAVGDDPGEKLPAEVQQILDQLLDGKYIEGTVHAIEYLRKHHIEDHQAAMLTYLHSRGSSLHSLQASYTDYFAGIGRRPRQLAAHLRHLDTRSFLLGVNLLYGGGGGGSGGQLPFTTVRFRDVRDLILQTPGGHRSLFVTAWEKCLPRVATSPCLELLTKALRLSSAAYLRPEMIAHLPLDLPEEIFRNITAVFKELYDDMTARSQRAIYEWIRQILQRPNRQPVFPKAGAPWIVAENLWFLGRFVVHLPPEEIQKISLNEIRHFINYDNATKQLDSVYDITPTTARAFQERINASGFDMANTSTVYRLGLLVCFFDNVQELDTGEARSLLHQMIKCSRLKGFQADVKKLKAQLLGLVLSSQRLNETLDSISDAIACLSFPQLDSLSTESVRSAATVLGTVRGWTPGQTLILADKFMGGNKQLSLFNLSRLGVLVLGVSADTLYNTSPQDLAQALQWPLSQHGASLSPAQRLAVVTQIAASWNVSSVLDLLNSSFLKELPLYNLLHMTSYNVSHLDQKELRKSQALFLYHLVSGTMPVQEILRCGQLVRGVTCNHLRALDPATFRQLDGLLRGSLSLLSPLQLNCLAQKYRQDAPDLMPPLLLVTLPTRVLAMAPRSICKPLLIALGRVELSSIVPQPAKRAEVMESVLWCLNYTIQDEYDVDILGRTICYLSPDFIRTITSNKALNEALIHFRICRNLSPAQKREVRNKIQEYYGDPTAWQPELMQDLGPLITLLSREDLTTVAEKFPDILLQLALDVEGTAVSEDFLAAVFHALKRTIGTITPSNLPPGCGGTRTPSSEHILKLADANSHWSAGELRCLSPETFVRSVELLGALTSFSMAQLLALKEKAKEVWGPVRSWRKHQVRALGHIALSLNQSEIRELELGSTDTVAALIRHRQWSPPQVRSLLEGFLHDSGLPVEALSGWDLAGLDRLLCAMTGPELDSVSTAAYSVAAARVGELACEAQVLRRLLRKAREVFGDVGQWHGFVLWEVGTVAAGMSGEELKLLVPDLMPYFTPAAMAILPTHVFKELSPEQLKKLGPENSAAVTAAQEAALNREQLAGLQAARDGGDSNETPLSTAPLTGSAYRGEMCFLLWAAFTAVYFADYCQILAHNICT